MNIAFATTQSPQGSTVVGRVLPLAQELAKKHAIHVLVHEGQSEETENIAFHTVGKDPFTHTDSGKKRVAGIQLISRMKLNALKTLLTLTKIKPDIVIIVKPLPQNVLATWLYQAINRKAKFILDVDDFELTANKLTSIAQRAAVHWSERTATRLTDSIVTATPFLQDHFRQLAADTKSVELIPTGINPIEIPGEAGESNKTISYIGSASIASGHRVDLLPDILEGVKKEIPDVNMIIAGSGDDITNLKSKFAKKNLADSVKWFGRFTRMDIPGLIAKTSTLIDPIDAGISNRAKSSFRTALAGVTGTPIVTSDVGIRPMFLPQKLHESSFASPENAADYTKKIAFRLNNPLTTKEKQNMQQHAMRYTWTKLATQYEELIIN